MDISFKIEDQKFNYRETDGMNRFKPLKRLQASQNWH